MNIVLGLVLMFVIVVQQDAYGSTRISSFPVSSYSANTGLKTGDVIKEIDGVVVETRYFISNLEEKYIKLISNVIRNEWWIENKLHWYLDMSFEEDKNRSYLENSQKNLNIIRKLCLSILKLVKDKYKLSMNSIRFLLGMDFENEFEKLINNLKIC